MLIQRAVLILMLALGSAGTSFALDLASDKRCNETRADLTLGDQDKKLDLAFQAILERNLPIFGRFLERGLAPEASLPDERLTLLMAASFEGWVEGVQLLLTAGAQVDSRDCRGFTPLAWAAASLKTDVVQVLLEAGADPTVRAADGLTALERARNQLRTKFLSRSLFVRLPRWTAKHPVLDVLTAAEAGR